MSIKGFLVGQQIEKYDYNALDNIPKNNYFSDSFKEALLQFASKVAYVDEHGQTYYDDLYNALYPRTGYYTIANNLTGCTTNNSATTIQEDTSYTAIITVSAGYTLSGATVTITMGGNILTGAFSNGTINIPNVTGDLVITVVASTVIVSSISAAYTQSGPVYDTDTLNSLKTDLVITAHYSDDTTQTVSAADYTLSGTLAAGTSTITVSYGGKTATFNVTVTHLEMTLQSIEADFNQGNTIIYTDDNYEEVIPPLLHVYGIYSAVIDGSTVTRTVEVTDYTLSGILVEGRSMWTAIYENKRATFYVTATRYVPDGYITDGLVFFLDGKHGASANQWKDLIGDKIFALTNCTLGTNGVVFNGSTSYGEYNGAVTSDWENETIEVVVTVADPTQSQNRGILYQPLIDGHTGISMHFGYHGNGQPRFALCTDGVNRATAWATLTQAANKVGGNADRVILNGTAVTNTDNTNYAVNTTGKAVIGCRKTASSPDGQHFFEGTIHAIRIYSRKLSQAEILANQSVDAEYYGV